VAYLSNGSSIFSISIAPSYVNGWNKLLSSSDRCFLPKIKSIHKCNLSETYWHSSASLCFSRKSFGLSAHFGKITSSTLSPFALIPKSRPSLLIKKSASSGSKNSGLSSLTFPGLVSHPSYSKPIPLNNLLGLS